MFTVKKMKGGAGWAVVDGNGSAVKTYKASENAEAAADRMTRKAKNAKTKRPCMACETVFESYGIGNRLCGNCRRHSENMAGGAKLQLPFSDWKI